MLDCADASETKGKAYEGSDAVSRLPPGLAAESALGNCLRGERSL